MADLGGSGGKAFQFENVGDGFDDAVVLSAEMRQDTTLKEGVPLVFYRKKPTPIDEVPANMVATCDPVPALWVEVKTEYRNHEGLEKPMDGGDDGTRTVVFSKGRFIELKKITRSVNEGGLLSVRLKAFGTPPEKGFNKPKLFEGGIKYTPPVAGVDLGGKADPTQGDGATAADVDSAKAGTTDGVQHGPRPDYIPESGWSQMDGKARAAVSPF
jgi:hypothetical protein